MAFEVPTDLIRQLQIMLRNHAGIPTYDPEDPSLHSLPSLRDAISGFDPSPPYLRCKNCNGRFLRGLASLICVYCGQEQKKELTPEPIKFNSTVGYRWLLDSMHLDGSEIVGPSEENESNRGQSRQKDEVSLSDLLDLEIKWPDESEQVGDGVINNASDQSKPSLNLAGVDLDNFFSESNDTIESGEQLGPNKQFRDTESNTFQGQKDLNLFENVQHSETMIGSYVDKNGERFASWEISSAESSTLQGHENLKLSENVRPSETAVLSTNDKSGDRFSGWEAEFQSSSSDTLHGDSSSFDPFEGSTVDLSAHMDSVFGPGNDTKHVKPKDDSAPPASTTNSWIQDDDIWTNFNSGLSNKTEQIEASTSIGRIQDDQWQTSSTKVPSNPTLDDDDSFDAWNDFASSTNGPSDSPLKQTSNPITSSAEHTSQENLFSSTSNLQTMEFSSFEQPDPFMGAFSDKIDSKEVNFVQSEASALDRMADESTKAGARIDDGHIKATVSSEANDVEMLMSQMHDLSFMLGSNLSIPKS